MDIYPVSFFGHRKICNQLHLDRILDDLIARLLREHSYVEFLIGRDGNFDQLVSSPICRCQREHGHHNSSYIWVIPYPSSFFLDNEEACYDYYDEIEICEESFGKHFKTAFLVRNHNMVDRSNLVIFYVAPNESAASKTMQYAIEQGKVHMNLYHAKEEEQ